MDYRYLFCCLILLLSICFNGCMIFIIIKNLKEIKQLQKDKKQAIERMNAAILGFEKGENENEDTFN